MLKSIVSRACIVGVITLLLTPVLGQDPEPLRKGSAQGSPLTGSSSAIKGLQEGGNFVNPFTGQAAFSIPLGEISNLGGISFSIGMNYSSNNSKENYAASNRYSPTSWVGHGFIFEMPKITANLKGTEDIEDDEYYLNGLELIPSLSVSSNNKYYLKGNPSVTATRTLGNLELKLKRNGNNIDNPVPTSSQVKEWIVEFPNGTKYQYGENYCTIYADCVPVVHGYVKFSNRFDTDESVIPNVWHLRSIKDSENKYAIWFNYWQRNVTESVGTEFTNTYYVEKQIVQIYSTHGVNSTDPKIDRAYFNQESKPTEEYVDQHWWYPWATVNEHRLGKIDFFYREVKTHSLNLIYTASTAPNNKTRFEKLEREDAAFGVKETVFQVLSYDADNRVDKILYPNGLEIEYTYEEEWTSLVNEHVQEVDFRNEVDFNGGTAGVGKPIIKMKRQIGNKYYMQFEDELAVGTCGSSNKEVLLEFELIGTYWKLKELPTNPIKNKIEAPVSGCKDNIDFAISPDGSYALFTNGNGKDYDIYMYDLTKDNPEISTPTWSIDFVDQGIKSEDSKIYVFNDWFVVHTETDDKYKGLKFFYKNSSGTWVNSCPFTMSHYNPGNAQYSGEDENLEGCMELDQVTSDYGWEITQGPNYLVANNKNVDILHVFAFQSGTIKDFTKGLTNNGNNDGGFHNNWSWNIEQINATENFITVFDEDNYLYVFEWNGVDLNYLYSKSIYYLDKKHVIYASNNYFVIPYVTSSNNNNVKLYSFNRASTTKFVERALHDFNNSNINNVIGVNLSGDFIYLEDRLTPQGWNQFNDLKGNFIHDYNYSSSRKLFKINSTWGFDDLTSDLVTDDVACGVFSNHLACYKAKSSSDDEIDNVRIGKLNNTDASFTDFGELTTAEKYSDLSVNPLSSGFAIVSYSYLNSEMYSDGKIKFLYRKPKFNDPDLEKLTRRVSKITHKTRGSSSSTNDGTELSKSYVYGNTYYNFATNTLNHKTVSSETNPGRVLSTFKLDEVNSQLLESERNFHGLVEEVDVEPAYPGTPGVAQVGGAEQDITYHSRVYSTDISTDDEFYFVEQPKSVSKDYYFNAFKTTKSFSTDLRQNGGSRISASRVGNILNVQYTTYLSDWDSDKDPALVRQVTNYVINNSTLCPGTNPADPCPNVTQTKLHDTYSSNAVSSTYIDYDANDRVLKTYKWNRIAAGLDNNKHATAPTNDWINIDWIVERNDGNNLLSNKTLGAVQSRKIDVYSTTYHNGVGQEIGVISNAEKWYSALLTGEEQIQDTQCATSGTCLGTFGRWSIYPTTSLVSDVTHTGQYSIKETGLGGPVIDLNLLDNSNTKYRDRKKGMVVSFWIYATSDSDPMAVVQYLPNSTSSAQPWKDLISDYKTLKGLSSFPINMWVKVEFSFTYKEMDTQNFFGDSDKIFRVWLGKGSSTNSNAVFLDDIRVYPVDATVATQNYDSIDMISSTLGPSNEPVFYKYDVWGNSIGQKNSKGLSYSSSGAKPVHINP